MYGRCQNWRSKGTCEHRTLRSSTAAWSPSVKRPWPLEHMGHGVSRPYPPFKLSDNKTKKTIVTIHGQIQSRTYVIINFFSIIHLSNGNDPFEIWAAAPAGKARTSCVLTYGEKRQHNDCVLSWATYIVFANLRNAVVLYTWVYVALSWILWFANWQCQIIDVYIIMTIFKMATSMAPWKVC